MRNIMKSALDIIGGVFVMALVVIMFWLFLVITPDQNSAESDALREEMRQKGIIE